MIDGILNVYKEKGYTSHDVVAILRKKLQTKKIGHTGTLDPEAEGVLPICIGKATKAAEYLTNKTKVYMTTMQLGISTDTQDHTGKVINIREVKSSKDEIVNAINSFVGEYRQIPPMYSALKVNGKKLYELAREGKIIERKPRDINIYSIEEINIQNNNVSFKVSCSKGTYIRTLCHDIGEILKCGAHMTALIRVQSGNYFIDDSMKIDEIIKKQEAHQLNDFIQDVDRIFSEYKSVLVDGEYNKFLFNGNKVHEYMLTENNGLNEEQTYRVYDEHNQFIGIYQCIYERDTLVLKPIKIFGI